MIGLTKNMALLSSATLALSFAPYLAAQSTIARQQERSARILSNGTIEAGSTNPDWLTVSHTTGSAIYNLTFTPAFTSKPNCVVTADAVAGSGIRWAEIHAPLNTPQSLNTLQVYTTLPLLGVIVGAIDASFTIHCAPDTPMAVSAVSWDASGNQLSGSDWVTVSRTSTGQYLLIFKRPYQSVPDCVATPQGFDVSDAQIFSPSVNGTFVLTRTFTYTNGNSGLVVNANDEAGSAMCSGPQ